MGSWPAAYAPGVRSQRSFSAVRRMSVGPSSYKADRARASHLVGVVGGGAAGAGQVDGHAQGDGGGVVREEGGELSGAEGREHAVRGLGVRRTGGVEEQHLRQGVADGGRADDGGGAAGLQSRRGVG